VSKKELVDRIREGIRGRGPGFVLHIGANPGEWRGLIDENARLHEMADRLRIELKACVEASRRNGDWAEQENERLEALCQRAWDLLFPGE
jgi:hypothetical protein